MQVRLEGEKALRQQMARLASEYPKDAQRALNKTAQRSATRTRRDLSRAIGIAQKEIKNRVSYFKAGGRRRWASVWVGTKSSIPLAKVGGARMTLNGQLRAGKVRVQTFRATMPSGYRGSFVRKPGSKHKVRPDGQRTELPIEEPRIRLVEPARPIILSVTQQQMAEFFPVELKRLVKRTTERAASKRSKR